MAVLLRCEDNDSMVTAFHRAYPVVDGFVYVDVKPFQEPDKAGTIDSLHRDANARTDAAEIMKINSFQTVGNMRYPRAKFRSANEAEINDWQAKHATAPANKGDKTTA